MEGPTVTNKTISNLHMENYFPKDMFPNIDGHPNPSIHNIKTFEKYFESAAKDNVDRCHTSTVKEWVNKNLPVEYTQKPKPTPKLNLGSNINSFYNTPVSDYTRDAYNRIEQLKKLQEAYSVLRQKLQEKRKASCSKEASEAEAAALDTQRLIIGLKGEDKEKIATELLLQNAEDLGIPPKDLESLSELPFNEALKSLIDSITNMINNKFTTNLKDRCDSARRKAGAEYRDEMETIKAELSMYKTKSEKLESTISALNSSMESDKDNAEKIQELQRSLKESNNQVNELKESLYNMAKANEELEKNEVKLEQTLDELERYKLESEKLESAIKDLELLNQQKHENEELIKMLQDELDHFKSKSVQLNSKIEILEDSNKQNLEPLNAELIEAYNKLTELEESYEKMESQKNETDKKLEYSIDEIEKHKLYSEELEESIIVLEQKIEHMEKDTSDQVRDLQTCLIDANCKIESLEGTISQLKLLNSELESGENKINELQSKLAESNSTIEKLEKTISELEGVSNKYIDYDEKMDNLQKQVKEYTLKIKELENNASEFDYKGQAEALKAELDKSQQRILELEKLFEEKNAANGASNHKSFDDKSSTCSEATNEENASNEVKASNEVNALIEKIATYEKAIKDKEAAIEKMTEEKAAYEKAINMEKEEINEKEKALSEKEKALNSQKEAINEKIATHEKALNDKEKALFDKEKALSEKETALIEKENALNSQKEEISEMGKAINEKALNDKEKALSEKSAQVESLNAELASLKKQTADLKKRTADLESQKADLEQKLNQYTAYADENRKFKQQIELLEGKLTEIEKKKAKEPSKHAEPADNTTANKTPANSDAPELSLNPIDLLLDPSQLYNRKSSRKGKKKSSKDTSRSDRSTSRHSKKDKEIPSDIKGTVLSKSLSYQKSMSETTEKIAEQLNVVKQTTLTLTGLGYDSLSNVGSYLSDYIFGSN